MMRRAAQLSALLERADWTRVHAIETRAPRAAQ
jgi:hypothetical protein